MQAKELQSNFTKRYVTAIILIALLSTGAFYVLNMALKQSDTTALVVNISGKQRMLSQRVASLSQQYYIHRFNSNNHLDPEAIKHDLLEALTEMRKANEALTSGRISTEISVELSAEMRELYFGETELQERVERYLNLAQSLTSASTPQEMMGFLKQIVDLSNPLLFDLNRAVLQYQKEGEAKIKRVSTLETLVWLVTLMTLLLEVIFIFQPMANKIRELFQEVLWDQEHLEHQVAMRTMSLEQTNAKLLQLASHDPLTGLKNRLNMETDLEALIVQYEKHRLPYAVVMFDIDWFKAINDTYGHEVGDFVLIEIARIIKSGIRMQDSAYRSGGEEFVVIFNRITLDQVIEKAEAIRHQIEEHRFLFNDFEIRCTISGGIYHPHNVESMSVQGVLKLADDALYDAKHSGRNMISK
jgi:two-component system, cell cycle response regulator